MHWAESGWANKMKKRGRWGVASPWAKPKLVEMGAGPQEDHGPRVEWPRSTRTSGLLCLIGSRAAVAAWSPATERRLEGRDEAGATGTGPASCSRDELEEERQGRGDAVDGHSWRDLGRWRRASAAEKLQGGGLAFDLEQGSRGGARDLAQRREEELGLMLR